MPVTLVQQSNRDYINLKDYCKLDGASDDSAGFTAAYTLASSLGMSLFHPGGTLLKGNDTLLTGVGIVGAGVSVSIIKLKNGANVDLFSANTGNINLAGANGTGSTTGVQQWRMCDLTLDGNKANQTSGTSYPLRFYGCGYILDNLMVMNGYSGGILCDWNAGLPASHNLSALWKNVQVTDCNGMGIEFGGPSDSKWINVVSQQTVSHNIHLTPNAGGLQATNCHGWGAGTGTVAWLIEATGTFINCEAENSDTVQLVLLSGRVTWTGGRIFAGFGSPAGAGIQIGQVAGGTPIAGEIAQSAGAKTTVVPQDYLINTLITDISSSNGSIWLVNDGGGIIDVKVNQASGKYFTGTLSNNTRIALNGTGLTADGTAGMGSMQVMPSKAYRGFTVTDPTFGDIFTVDTLDHQFQILSNAQIKIYSDQYATISMVLNNTGNGEILLGNSGSLYSGPGAPATGLGAIGDYYFRTGTPATFLQRLYVKTASAVWTDLQTPVQSATAVAIAANGAIPTAGLNVSRLAPTAARTGITMQAGTYAGQQCFVINESAFVLTYNATPATSLIANSAAVTTLPVTSGRLFCWNSSTSLWY